MHNEAPKVYEMYRRTFAGHPIGQARFIQFIKANASQQKTHILYHRRQPVACVVYGRQGISFLCVLPEYQNAGLGTGLLAHAEGEIKKMGGQRIALGNAGAYLWQGVPILDERAVRFFTKHGYTSDWTSIDMVKRLKGSPETEPPKLSLACGFLPCASHEKAELAQCVERTNPQWTRFFTDASLPNTLVCKYGGRIVGFVILILKDIAMEQCFPGKVGGFGCLGVEPEYREKGIGLRLAYEATMALQKLGYEYAYIGYTWLEDWYGKLGYRKFMSFWMGYKDI